MFEVLKWIVDDFDFYVFYVFINLVYQNLWGYVNFNVFNDVVFYIVLCSVFSSQLFDFFYGIVEYVCILVGIGVLVGVKVGFKFSRFVGMLEISEIIDCSDKQVI